MSVHIKYLTIFNNNNSDNATRVIFCSIIQPPHHPIDSLGPPFLFKGYQGLKFDHFGHHLTGQWQNGKIAAKWQNSGKMVKYWQNVKYAADGVSLSIFCT
jgi:hypothetical protein